MEIKMLVVGSKVIQREQSFLYIAARGEVIDIKLVNGQPLLRFIGVMAKLTGKGFMM